MQPSNKRGIPELDAVRGIAASAVALWHWFSMGRIDSPWFVYMNEFFSRGAEVAVTVFFVLSGCVLTLSLRSNPQLGRYFLRRFLRLMPLLALVIIVSVIGMAALRYGLGTSQKWTRYSDFSTLRILKNFVFLDTHFVPPGWTLRYEVAAYILLPFLIFSIKGRYLMAVPFVAIGAAMAIYWLTVRGFVQIMPMFIPGVVLGFILPRHVPKPSLLLVAGIIVVGLVLWIEEKQYSLTSFMAIGCAMVIAAATRMDWLNLSAPRRLGEISYGVFLWHYPILWAGFYLAGTFVGTKSVTLWVLVGIAGLAVTVLVSVLTYRFIEVPALSLARKPLNRFEASAAPP